jgi:hypothetical protein
MIKSYFVRNAIFSDPLEKESRELGKFFVEKNHQVANYFEKYFLR